MPVRDDRIEYIESRDRFLSGAGLGIILVDEIYPAFPGDVRNPSAYPYPIQYEIAEGLSIQKLVREGNKEQWLPCIERAAKKLERMGCRAILAECGYFAYFQKEIAQAVNVPVFMSSLIQIPWAQASIAPNRVVGVLCASSVFMEEKHLTSVGVTIGTNYVIRGARDNGKCPELGLLWDERNRTGKPRANFQKAEEEFMEQALDFYRSIPNMGAMIFECTGFPPFARDVQRIIDIPIYSWATLMDYANSTSVHREFYGNV